MLKTYQQKLQHTWADTLSEVYENFLTTKGGLCEEEVKKRREKYGPNKLPEKRPVSPLTIVYAQFKNSLILILTIAFGVTLFFHEYSDALIIAFAVLTNVIFGFIQEFKAHKAFSALKKIVTYNAKVHRDKKFHIVNVQDLVLGDILILEAGDRVPADARLIECQNLTVNEAPLTGESTPVKKYLNILAPETPLADRVNMVFLGTTILDGYAEALVVNSGSFTELGKIAQSLQEINTDESPLQLKLKEFSRVLGLVILVIAAFVFIAGIGAQKPLFEMFETAVAIAVAALPEGLAVAVTVILAVGMQRILQQNALVRKLLALETLGSTTVICTDKTGTLTKGEMVLEKVVTFNNVETNQKGEELMKALEIAILCNNAQEEENTHTKEIKIKGSPTEQALYSAGLHAGIGTHELKKKYKRIEEVPFNSERKFMLTRHATNIKSEHVLFIKGAPDKLFPFASRAYDKNKETNLTNKRKNELMKIFEAHTKSGYRLLLGGYKKMKADDNPLNPKGVDISDYSYVLSDFVFVGLYGIRDPIRKDVQLTLKRTHRAGIKTLMITGDHKFTAQAIAREIGLITHDDEVLEGADMEKISDDELKERIKKVKVFARVTPEDKLRLVRLMKESGEIVAMTGDGVNDAPALTRADIGIALGSGTDVAKGASDIVLLKNNFSVIVKAIEEGRVIFDNIRKVVLYLLSDNFSTVILISLALILSSFFEPFRNMPLPITAAQILWINIISDGLPSFSLTLEPKDPDIMTEPPRDPKAPVLNKEMKFIIAMVSTITATMVFFVFLYFWQNVSLEKARTISFMALGINSLFYIFSIRSLRYSLLKQNPLSNPWMIAGVVGGSLLQISTVYFQPLRSFLDLTLLSSFEWTIILSQSVIVIVSIESVKAFYNSRVK